MPVLTKAKFIFGFEHAGSGTETPPILNAFASARGEKDRALIPLPPAFNSLAAHSFKKWIAGVWWVLGFHCSQLSSSLAVQLSQALQRLITKYSQKSAVVTPWCCTCSFPMCKHYQIFLPVATTTRRKPIQRQAANCIW